MGCVWLLMADSLPLRSPSRKLIDPDGRADGPHGAQGHLRHQQADTSASDLALLAGEVRLRFPIPAASLSSRCSGPKRYMYSFEKRQWRNTRDGHALADILSEELTKLSGVELRLRDPEV